MYTQKWVILFDKARKHHANQGSDGLNSKAYYKQRLQDKHRCGMSSTIILKMSSAWALSWDLKVSGSEGKVGQPTQSGHFRVKIPWG